jgi:hypothetical protein
MRRGLTVGLAMVIAAVAPGCGGSGPSASDKQVAAITDTFNSYIAALQRGDGRTACSLLSPAYQRRAAKLITPIKKPQLKAASCSEALSKGTLPVLKTFHPSLERVQVNGKHASGFQPGQGPFGPQKTFFVHLNGDWKITGTIYVKQAPKSSG